MRAPDPETVKAAADRAEAGRRPAEPPRGRGRLSSLDQLPEDAQDDVVWAVGQLNERKRTQADILFELNDRLRAKGVDEVSKSAFNRASMKYAVAQARFTEMRRIFEGIAPHFTPERVDESGMVIGEFIKMLIFELAQSEGASIGAKGAMELARGHLAAIQAQNISSERRAKLEAKFKAEAEKAVDKVAVAKGLTADTVEVLKATILGMRKDAT